MKPLLCFCLLPVILTSCWMDDPATGTNDEVTTSLQILADNVKSLGGTSSGAARTFAGRAMIGGASDTGRWIAFDFVDHGSYSVWQLQWNGSCQPIPGSDACVATDRRMIDDLPGLSSTTSRWRMRGSQSVSIASVAEYQRRSGFKYFVEDSSHADPLTGKWITDGNVMTFPGIDARIPLPTGPQDSLWMSSATGSTTTLPIFQSGKQIGKVVQSGSSTPRWFDMSGKEYHGAPLSRNSFGPDSLGIHLTSTRPDTVGGVPGIRLAGWLYMPDSFGISLDSVRASIEGESSGTNYAYNFHNSAPGKEGRIDYFLPVEEWRTMRASQYGSVYSRLRLAAFPVQRSALQQGIRSPAGDYLYSDTAKSLPLP